MQGYANEEELCGMKSPVESKFELFLCGGAWAIPEGLTTNS